MSTNRIILNETSYFGPGSRAVLADEIKKRGFKKVFGHTRKSCGLCINFSQSIQEKLHINHTSK